jgi:prepilin peptidase CpaA
MFGKISFAVYAVYGVAIVGALFDLKRRRIPNELTFGAMATALVFFGTQGGLGPLAQSLLSIGLGFVLLGWMFFVGWMGAGDVKFLMALGAWMGPRAVAQTAVLSILIGGVMALIQVGMQKDARKRLTKIWRFFQSIFIKELKLELPNVDQRLRMPFGVAIALAAILIMRGLDVWRMLGIRNF